jgi:SP family general alpha glucoside:H+ symporter-like MFS transporter
MAQEMAFNYSMAIQSINIFATGTAVYLMGRLNRRTFYLFGTSTICVAQIIIGVLGIVGGTKVAAGIAGMMIVINLAFKLSLGPACYTMISEMPNSRLRAYTIVLARASYILVSVCTNQIIPRQLGAWNWGGWVFSIN